MVINVNKLIVTSLKDHGVGFSEAKWIAPRFIFGVYFTMERSDLITISGHKVTKSVYQGTSLVWRLLVH